MSISICGGLILGGGGLYLGGAYIWNEVSIIVYVVGLYSGGGGLIVGGLRYAHKVKVSSLVVILLLYANAGETCHRALQISDLRHLAPRCYHVCWLIRMRICNNISSEYFAPSHQPCCMLCNTRSVGGVIMVTTCQYLRQSKEAFYVTVRFDAIIFLFE